MNATTADRRTSLAGAAERLAPWIRCKKICWLAREDMSA